MDLPSHTSECPTPHNKLVFADGIFASAVQFFIASGTSNLKSRGAVCTSVKLQLQRQIAVNKRNDRARGAHTTFFCFLFAIFFALMSLTLGNGKFSLPREQLVPLASVAGAFLALYTAYRATRSSKDDGYDHIPSPKGSFPYLGTTTCLPLVETKIFFGIVIECSTL